MKKYKFDLNRENVIGIYDDCLSAKGELNLQTIAVEGITVTANFSSEKIKKHEQDIMEMLSQLPDEFMVNKGGGWSFLNACLTNTGEMWTYEHSVMEKLFLLGMGINKVKCALPREFWGCFPGKMPYYIILNL